MILDRRSAISLVQPPEKGPIPEQNRTQLLLFTTGPSDGLDILGSDAKSRLFAFCPLEKHKKDQKTDPSK
jgi:hypothetical protein